MKQYLMTYNRIKDRKFLSRWGGKMENVGKQMFSVITTELSHSFGGHNQTCVLEVSEDDK